MCKAYAILSVTLIVLSISFPSCARNESISRLEGELDSLASQVNSYHVMFFPERIETRKAMLVRIDSLINQFPKDVNVIELEASKNRIIAGQARDREFYELFRLAVQVETLEVQISESEGDDANAKASSLFEKLKGYMSLVGLADSCAIRVQNNYPNDPLIDTVTSISKLIQYKQRVIGLTASTTVALLIGSLGDTSYKICSMISEIWAKAIDAGLPFNDYVEQATAAFNGADRSLSKVDGLISDGLMCLYGNAALRDGRLVASLESAYLRTKNLHDLSRSPQGSLMSYRSEYNRIHSEIRDQLEIYKLEFKRISNSQ